MSPAFSLAPIDASPARRTILSRHARRPVEYVYCDVSRDPSACGLLQNAAAASEPVAPEFDAFRSTRLTRNALRSAATEALELISGRDCAALDIGCGDGALLSFYPRWVDRFGVDPRGRSATIGSWAKSFTAEFPSAELDLAFAGRKFDIVTAISILEEIADPRAFLSRIAGLLAPDGVLVLETAYGPATLTRNGVDAVCGPGVALYSLGALERLMRDCGFKIFRGGLTDKSGGSIRIFAAHAGVDDYDFDPWYERLARLWDEENVLGLGQRQPYQAFEQRAEAARASFAELMRGLARRGQNAHILGLGAPAAMLLAWAGEAAHAIEAAIDPGAEMDGGFDLGERVCVGGPAVISERESRCIEPDCLIVPAPLRLEALERWREHIQRGQQLIFATPSPVIVNAGNYAAEFAKALKGAGVGAETDTLRSILGAAGGFRVVADNTRRASA